MRLWKVNTEIVTTTGQSDARAFFSLGEETVK